MQFAPSFLNVKFEEKLPYELLYRINVWMSVDREMAYESFLAISRIENESVRTSLLSMLIHWLMIKWPTSDEVVGLLNAVFHLDNLNKNKKPKIDIEWEFTVWCAWSWKKWIKTFNISTPAAILAASSWAYIAKACSASTSSLTWSSDLLSLLWIKLSDAKKWIRIMKKSWIAFFSIEMSSYLNYCSIRTNI